MDERPDVSKLFQVWLDDVHKVMVTVFFRNNPGVVDTLPALAQRLGMPQETLQRTISDHVELGLLRVRRIGRHEIVEFDGRRQDQLELIIAEEMQRRMEGP